MLAEKCCIEMQPKRGTLRAVQVHEHGTRQHTLCRDVAEALAQHGEDRRFVLVGGGQRHVAVFAAHGRPAR